MNTTATWYRMGQVQSGEYAGRVGYDGGPVVGRFAFTTGNAGASALSFRSSTLRPAGASSWAGGGTDGFRWLLGTNAEEHRTRCGSYGEAVSVYWGENNYLTSDGNQQVQLLPGTLYYLWIFPAAATYNLWQIDSLTVTLSGSYGSPASPSAGEGYFGEDLVITLSGGSAGARYTVRTSCAGRQETLQQKGGDTVLTWRPGVADYAPLLPDSATATATITVETWHGELSVGTRSCSVALRLREEDVQPVLRQGWYSHVPYNEGAAAAISRYVQGRSRAELVFDAEKIETRYGASIAGYTLSCGGVDCTQSPYRSPVLTGESALTVSVTDSRGFSASESFSVTPLPYQEPRLDGVSAFRCDENGEAAEDGHFLSLTATALFSPMEGENSAAIVYRLRTAAGSFGAEQTLASGVRQIVPGLDADLNYEAELTVRDRVGGSGVLLLQIPGRRWAMKFRERGDGVGFGMAPQGGSRLEIPESWEIRRGGDLYVPLRESGSSGIWRWKKWADGSFLLTGSSLVTADVDAAWGGLYRGVVLEAEAFPFAVTAIDYAAAWIAASSCLAQGSLGTSLTDTGQIAALSAVPLTQASLPLRLLIWGRWQ